jgi:NAD(P)-dependent dehydrogenase (short-subunit alcohol dehydrogenase family)
LGLQKSGYSVALAGRRAHELNRTAALADSSGGEMLAIPTDVSDPASVAALFDGIRLAFGRLDILFNNAGVSAPAVPMEDISSEQWDTIVGVNVTGAFLCAQHAMRMMKAQTPRGGRIINNGSISAHTPRPHSAPYTMAKHAMTGLTKSICLDGRAFDIAGSQIDIGNAATDMTERMAEPKIDVQHVSDAVLYIASQPLDVNVPFMIVMATAMPFAGRG